MGMTKKKQKELTDRVLNKLLNIIAGEAYFINKIDIEETARTKQEVVNVEIEYPTLKMQLSACAELLPYLIAKVQPEAPESGNKDDGYKELAQALLQNAFKPK